MMALIDYGVIVVKNGSILDDVNYEYSVGPLMFYKYNPLESRHINKAKNHLNHFVDININNIHIRTKTSNGYQFITLINYENNNYAILHGYDIDFNVFYEKHTKCVVNDFIKTYTYSEDLILEEQQ
jgi:hypothetical protein